MFFVLLSSPRSSCEGRGQWTCHSVLLTVMCQGSADPLEPTSMAAMATRQRICTELLDGEDSD